MAENLHSGHRGRVRKEFLQNGFDENTPSHKILEMLLFYSIPRKDTNDIAHMLIKRFGSLEGVLDAPVSELVKVNGISENSAVLIKMIMPISRIYTAKKIKRTETDFRYNNLGDYLLNRYSGYTKEVLTVISLTNAGRVIAIDDISQGSVGEVNISIRLIMEAIVKNNATCAVIAHNHPDGIALPSHDDIESTIDLRRLLGGVGINLIDHIIISDGDYISMAQSQRHRHIFENNYGLSDSLMR